MFEFTRQRGSSLFFILAIPTLFISQYLSLRFNSKVHDDFAWVTHTFEVAGELQSTQTKVLDIQNGLRGYLITHAPVELGFMNQASLDAAAHIAAVEKLTVDNPLQQKNVAVLKELLRARIEHAEGVVRTYEKGGFIPAQKIIATGRGTELTRGLLAKLDEMQMVEAVLLKRREAAAHHSANSSSLTVIFGGLFSTLLLAFAAAFVRRDSKARAKANAALLMSEQKFKATFSHSPVGMGMTSLTGIWLDVNQALCKIIGYRPEEMIGRHFNEISHPDDFAIGPLQIKRVLQGEQEIVVYEKRVIAKDGEVVFIQIHVTALRDEAGKAERLLGQFLDITARKKTEAALIQEKEFSESVTSLVPNSIYIFDVATRTYVYSNQEFKSFLGYTALEIDTYGSEFIKKIIHPDDLEMLTRIFRDLDAQSSDRNLLESVMRLKNAKGEWKWVLYRLAVFKRDASGMPLQLIGVSEDISDLKQKEAELAQAVKTKAEFLANMSHEIRTPLNGIIATTDILLETQLDNEQIKFARIVQSSGLSLLTIINDILDFSKIEAGKFEMDSIEFSIPSIVEGQLDLLVGKAREKQLSLASFIAPDLPLKVMGDPGRLGQILLNLIGNAIKFTHSGGIIVRVTADPLHTQQAQRVRVRIEVEDSGIGISDSVAAKLFQPFTQADSSTSRKYGGTGLGLSISKKLVEYMLGEIGVKEGNLTVGLDPSPKTGQRGSIFWFTAEFALPEPVAYLPQPDYLRDLRIVVCDPDLLSVKAIASYLDAWKMRNTEAISIDEVFTWIETARLEKDPYRLFIVAGDLFHQHERRIKDATEAQNPSLKIIVLDSMLTRSSEQLHSLIFDVVDTMGKPVKQSALLDKMMTALGQESILQSLASQPAGGQRLELSAAQKEHNRQYKILIAEDNSVNQIIALKILETLGYNAQAVANGREAIDALHQNHYDLVLMDCQMPELDGYEAAAQVRLSADLKVRRIPIIALTANAMKGDEERCIAAGMNDYLSKPIRKEKLATKLALWLT